MEACPPNRLAGSRSCEPTTRSTCATCATTLVFSKDPRNVLACWTTSRLLAWYGGDLMLPKIGRLTNDDSAKSRNESKAGGFTWPDIAKSPSTRHPVSATCLAPPRTTPAETPAPAALCELPLTEGDELPSTHVAPLDASVLPSTIDEPPNVQGPYRTNAFSTTNPGRETRGYRAGPMAKLAATTILASSPTTLRACARRRTGLAWQPPQTSAAS